MNNPYEFMSHGLIVSKLWLCDELEKVIEKDYNKKVSVYNLGSWTNILAFLMVSRKAHLYEKITGYDIDEKAIDIADKVCDTWQFEEPKILNVLGDANLVEFKNVDVVVNCSVEHMEENAWFDTIPNNTLVCLQSSNSNNTEWNIRSYNPSIEVFCNKYPLTNVLFQGTKTIKYSHWGYDRFMIIGYK